MATAGKKELLEGPSPGTASGQNSSFSEAIVGMKKLLAGPSTGSVSMAELGHKRLLEMCLQNYTCKSFGQLVLDTLENQWVFVHDHCEGRHLVTAYVYDIIVFLLLEGDVESEQGLSGSIIRSLSCKVSKAQDDVL